MLHIIYCVFKGLYAACIYTA